MLSRKFYVVQLDFIILLVSASKCHNIADYNHVDVFKGSNQAH